MTNVPLIDLLYTLKRDWGQPVKYVTITTSKANPETGQVGSGSHEFDLAQIVLFPVEIARTYVKAFRAGSYPYDSNYDKGSHVGLIQKSDLPLGVHPSGADTIITSRNERYEVKEVNDLYEAWELILVGLPTK